MAATKDLVIQVDPIKRETIRVAVLGVTPLICNAMSEKARQQLLFPSQRKNAAERASSLKHTPLDEFRASIYRLPADDAETLVAMLGTMFKQTMMTAALRLPGAAKSAIAQLCWVSPERVPVYGVPQMLMSVVRSADMNRTPDIRTRTILPRWACTLDITYVVPLLNEKTVMNLITAGGVLSGIGDWRPQKGGTNGQFEIVAPTDETFLEILKDGRAAQVEAMANPEFYDEETGELYGWFEEEAQSRGRMTVAK